MLAIFWTPAQADSPFSIWLNSNWRYLKSHMVALQYQFALYSQNHRSYALNKDMEKIICLLQNTLVVQVPRLFFSKNRIFCTKVRGFIKVKLFLGSQHILKSHRTLCFLIFKTVLASLNKNMPLDQRWSMSWPTQMGDAVLSEQISIGFSYRSCNSFNVIGPAQRGVVYIVGLGWC